MRLLHVLAETGYSGGEVQLEHLVRHLHAGDHENHFALVPGAQFIAVAETVGEVHTLPLRRPMHPGLWLGLRKLVRNLKPDVLHFGCGRSLQWGGYATSGLPVDLRITTRRIDYPIGKSWWRGGRYRSLVDHTVANCESVRRRVLEAGVPESRVSKVFEGIDMEPWMRLRDGRDAARVRLQIPRNAVVVSCAASLRPRKGQKMLIEAFARALQGLESDGASSDADRALLILAGEGTDQAALIEHAAAQGVATSVSIPGSLRPVADLYAASDVFVMPSFNEGLSNACLEASAAGLPLLVTSVGGLPEIVEAGVTGRVLPPGDVAAWTEAVRLAITDEPWRESCGAAGTLRTQKLFRADRMAQQMEALFLKLLAAKQSNEERAQ